jgi:hypothetical protein
MKFPFLIGAALIAVLSAAPVQAQTQCGHYSVVSKHLKEEYKEVVFARGATPQGMMVEFYASPKGSFTVLVVRGDGLACLVAAGEELDVQPVPQEPTL